VCCAEWVRDIYVALLFPHFFPIHGVQCHLRGGLRLHMLVGPTGDDHCSAGLRHHGSFSRGGWTGVASVGGDSEYPVRDLRNGSSESESVGRFGHSLEMFSNWSSNYGIYVRSIQNAI
jgi:hypothetical protein